MDTCATCNGTGNVWADPAQAGPDPVTYPDWPPPCPECGGTGSVRVVADLDAIERWARQPYVQRSVKSESPLAVALRHLATVIAEVRWRRRES